MLSLLAWYRFRDTRLDRDFTPYAYPAVMRVGYLTNGAHDIKPPLIHWSYKAWLRIISLLGVSTQGPKELRLLPMIGLALASVCVGILSPIQGLAFSLLCASPTLWAHMANTEWLTVLLWSAALWVASIHGMQPIAWLLLGLTPWANQKNVLLIAPVARALGLSLQPISLIALAPSLVIGGYLLATGRGRTFWEHCVVAPSKMGKSRTLKQNTLGHLHLLKPGLILMMPWIACMDFGSPWALVFLACVAVSLWSKQIVPHHFILWAFPLALASKPGPGAFLAYGVVWALRDLAIWLRPENIYKITFGAPQGDYGMRLEDGEWVARWLQARGVKEVWVNGMDNNVYLQAGVKAWNIVVPEWTQAFEGMPPKYIVHCPGSIAFDYDAAGYEMAESSPRNSYLIMERK